MSSDIQTTLGLLVLNNYISLASITVVAYDYTLTFSREIEYIWLKRWTWVSTMFVVVRYIGLSWIIAYSLFGTALLPGPLEVSIVLYQLAGWEFVVFFAATDLMMILRVYAMWNRSKTILSILLFIYVPQTISSVILDGIYDSFNTHTSITIAQVFDFSFCTSSTINIPATLEVYRTAVRLVLAAAIVTLAVSQTLKQSFEMYKATKQWQPNRYMQKLVGDGILYFTVNVLYQLINVLLLPAGVVTNAAAPFLSTVLYLSFYTLIPRFIISIRELYYRDISGRFHIDTGFGVQSRSDGGPEMVVSAIAFMDGRQGLEVEGDTNDPSDLELGRVHGSGLNEDSPVGGRE